MYNTTVIAELARLITAHKGGKNSYDTDIKEICRKHLPNGSGFDAGCSIDLDKSSGDYLVIHAPFHHMDPNGYYDGWTEYKLYIKPAFDGPRIRITGSDRKYIQVKDYIHDVFYHAITQSLKL